MHKCVRCGRIAVSLEEIDAGCPCGSKVFIFGKESAPVQNEQKGAAAKTIPNIAEQPKEAEAAAEPVAPDAIKAKGAQPAPGASDEIGVQAGNAARANHAPAQAAGNDSEPPEGNSASGGGTAPASGSAPRLMQAERTVVMESVEPEGKVPSSYYARASFTTEDVENIKVLTEGVFLIDVKSLSRDPMVLKDQEGVYYVKIPYEKKNGAENGIGKKGAEE